MEERKHQKEKAEKLHQLHTEKELLILPNVWNVLGAKLLVDTGYQAVATASAAIAYSNGYQDGEKIPFSSLLSIIKNMVDAVNVPLTADIESGYADTDEHLCQNMKALIEAGVCGINIEDTCKKTQTLYDIKTQCRRIQLIAKTAKEMQVPLFINARADVLLYQDVFTSKEVQTAELIQRALAYQEAGAHCFFPIALKQKQEIETITRQLKMPVNILALPGIPDIKTLKEIGVARLSLGPGYLKIAIQAMKTLAEKLRQQEGLDSVLGNNITSDYLKTLINH
ncbi:MAG: isocitrate lyase/phosphoenolpyruvate mutase family protein [Bacteroidetes bacterium]|nr:isocitrate lyase/phosphoenolpyruvate mutase family protein [Bacteroidota bacterium]